MPGIRSDAECGLNRSCLQMSVLGISEYADSLLQVLIDVGVRIYLFKYLHMKLSTKSENIAMLRKSRFRHQLIESP